MPWTGREGKGGEGKGREGQEGSSTIINSLDFLSSLRYIFFGFFIYIDRNVTTLFYLNNKEKVTYK